jgi:hypothetical protein
MFRSSIRAALLLAAVTVTCEAAFPTVASAQATPVATDTAARRIVLKLDPPFFFTGGYGGALGIRHRGLEVGVMGFSAPLPAVFRDQFLSNAKGRTVTRNIGLELYAQKDVAQWRWPISVGALISYDRFKLRDAANVLRQTDAFYVAPRAAIRIPVLHSRVFFEPALGLAVRLWEKDRAAQPTRAIAPLSFLTIGVPLHD